MSMATQADPPAENPRRLVDMEFRPGDLPPADAPSLDEALPEVTTRPPAAFSSLTAMA